MRVIDVKVGELCRLVCSHELQLLNDTTAYGCMQMPEEIGGKSKYELLDYFKARHNVLWPLPCLPASPQLTEYRLRSLI